MGKIRKKKKKETPIEFSGKVVLYFHHLLEISQYLRISNN